MAGTNKIDETTFDSAGATPQSRLNAATAPLTQGSLYALLLKLTTLPSRGRLINALRVLVTPIPLRDV